MKKMSNLCITSGHVKAECQSTHPLGSRLSHHHMPSLHVNRHWRQRKHHNLLRQRQHQLIEQQLIMQQLQCLPAMRSDRMRKAHPHICSCRPNPPTGRKKAPPACLSRNYHPGWSVMVEGQLVHMDEHGTGRSYDIPVGRFTKAAEKLSQSDVVSGIGANLLARTGGSQWNICYPIQCRHSPQ